LHVAQIPFENVSILLKEEVSTDPSDIESKFLDRRRGGYCFEQNTYLYHVLEHIGFNVIPLLARVRWSYPRGDLRGLTHSALIVTIDGKRWLVDVAFGSHSPTEPLQFDFRDEQHLRHGVYRIAEDGAGFVIQVKNTEARPENGGSDYCEFIDLYYLTLAEVFPVDWKTSNWFTSTCPESVFTRALLVARTDDEAVYTLFNWELTIRRCSSSGGKEVEKRQLDSQEDAYTVLDQIFGIRISDTESKGRAMALIPVQKQESPVAPASS
jgi:N-hydroxyarylamine O-acetyltransferase